MGRTRHRAPSKQFVLAAIAGGAAAACVRPAWAQHVYTGGAGDNLWCTPGNWDPPSIPSGSAIIGPEITQRVRFASNCTPTFTGLSAQGPVLFDGIVRNSGAILASDVIIQSGGFEVGPATLGGATFSINGLGVWRSGIIARQALRVESGATLDIDSASNRTLRRVDMTNLGTVTQRGTFLLDGFCPIVNSGTWTLAAPSVSVARIGVGNVSTFDNFGVLSCELPNGQGSAPLMNVAVRNEGEIRASSGDLDLLEFSSNGGRLSASAGRRLGLNRDSTFAGASQCAGDGSVTATIGQLRVASGVLLVALDQSGIHAGGFTLNTSSGLVIAPDATLENAGMFTWLRGTLLGESSPGAADGRFVNSAIFTARAASGTIQNLRIQNTAGARFVVDPVTQILLRDSVISSGSLATLEVRSGQIVRSPQSGPDTPTTLAFDDSFLVKTTTTPASIGCQVAALGGELNVLEGELTLAASDPAHEFVRTTITVAAGADLILGGAARGNLVNLAGAGAFTLRSGPAVLSIDGGISNNDMNGAGLILEGGKITGSGRLRNRGKLTLDSGTLGDSDTVAPPFELDNSRDLFVTGAGASRFAASILNLENGLITADAPIGMAGGAILFNEGAVSLGERANVGELPGSPPPQIRNEGLLAKRETGAAVISVHLANAAGEVEVQQGTLSITGPIEELLPNAAPPGTFTLADGRYVVQRLGTLTFNGRLVTRLALGASVRLLGSFNDFKPDRLSNHASAELGARVAPSTPFVAEHESNLRLAPGGELGTAPGGSPDATFRDSSRVSGNGVVDRDARLLDSSRAAPGYSPGELTFRSLAMPGGVLEIEIGGPTPVTEHDRITVVNHATLGGTLELSLLDGYAPPLGSAFTILAAGSLSGQFARVIQPPGLAPGLRLRPQVSGSTVVVRAVQEADFNADGFLDFFDFLDFVACFEGDPCPPGSDADFNADGFVDFFDYLDFVAAFEGG